MTSLERIVAAWTGKKGDHVPLTTWAFGLNPPADLQWETDGVKREFWYSMRLEHIHTLPQPWTLEDDFRRVAAWQSIGVDDILDVSVPWSSDPEVTWKDSSSPAGQMDPTRPVLVRDYVTPSGPLRHAVRRTDEEQGRGWVVQPDHVPLIEDMNIPRGLKHIVGEPGDVDAMKHLYRAPDEEAREWFLRRMEEVKAFAVQNAVPVQAWAGFGMDAIMWFTGVEGAILLAMDDPAAFGRLMDVITAADLGRAELAASTAGVDMVVARGWYSSTEFWSPDLFDTFVFPYIETLARATHAHGKPFGYVMTTGVETLGPRLADAGVDVLYFVDPVQDTITLERARELLSDRMTIVGAVNTVSLQSDTPDQVRDNVRRAMDVLGPTNRFILHPVDALFPDTPWAAVEAMIEAWKEYC